MIITRVEALHLRLPDVREVPDGTQDCLIIRVHTDAGITGLGEVVSCSYVGRAVVEAPRSAPFRHGLAAIVQGMVVEDITAIQQAMVDGTRWYGFGGVVRHAISGVDMALWDIKGKIEDRPVRCLLSEDAVGSVPCYASALWPHGPGAVATSASRFLDQGYRAVKYGWEPMGPDAELDEALVAAARLALGDHLDLMVDAGRAWDVPTARSRVERFDPYGLFWLEEPLSPYDSAGYADLCADSNIPIAAGEALTLIAEFEVLLVEGCIHIVQPDLGRVGGISGGQRLSVVAHQTGAWPVPHAFGTGILLAASAQWAAASPRPLVEYTQAASPLARNLVRHDMVFADGLLHLSDDPGLGVELDEEVVSNYRIS